MDCATFSWTVIKYFLKVHLDLNLPTDILLILISNVLKASTYTSFSLFEKLEGHSSVFH